MSAPDQLTLFEPDGVDAARLLERYVAEGSKHEGRAERFDLLGFSTAALVARSLARDARASALVLAVYLDLLAQVGDGE